MTGIYCLFFNPDNYFSIIIPLAETLLGMSAFLFSMFGIIGYIVAPNCYTPSAFKIIILVHIILFILSIFNTWIFRSNTFFSHMQSETPISSTMALSTTSSLMEQNDYEGKPWYHIYIKHYFITLLKIAGIIAEITFLIMYHDCPWGN